MRHQAGERGALLMLLTAAAINALKNTGLGFLAGKVPLNLCRVHTLLVAADMAARLLTAC